MAKAAARRRGGDRLERMAHGLWRAVGPARLRGGALALVGAMALAILASYRATDPSFDTSAAGDALNVLGASREASIAS